MPTSAPIVADRKYLDSLRDETCLLTGRYATDSDPVEPMHVGTAGKGIKNDAEAIPVCHSLHAYGHQHGEIEMLRAKAPAWLIREAFRAYARELYRRWDEQREKAEA